MLSDPAGRRALAVPLLEEIRTQLHRSRTSEVGPLVPPPWQLTRCDDSMDVGDRNRK